MSNGSVVNSHAMAVDLWILQVAKGLPRPELAKEFERALTALWKRTHTTLGDITLWAIAERVIFTATEKYASLATLRVEAGGIHFDEFRERLTPDSELLEAVRFVLVEFLTVIGNLTGEILTPAMHATLASVTRYDSSRPTEATKAVTSEPPVADGKSNGNSNGKRVLS